MAYSSAVLEFKFKAAVRAVPIVWVVHGLCVLANVLSVNRPFLSNPHFYFSSMAFVGFALLSGFYNYRKTNANLIIILFYVMFVCLEFGLFWQIPSIKWSATKGALTMLLVIGAPWLYFGCRILCVLPLLLVQYRAQNIKKTAA